MHVFDPLSTRKKYIEETEMLAYQCSEKSVLFSFSLMICTHIVQGNALTLQVLNHSRRDFLTTDSLQTLPLQSNGSIRPSSMPPVLLTVCVTFIRFATEKKKPTTTKQHFLSTAARKKSQINKETK